MTYCEYVSLVFLMGTHMACLAFATCPGATFYPRHSPGFRRGLDAAVLADAPLAQHTTKVQVECYKIRALVSNLLTISFVKT